MPTTKRTRATAPNDNLLQLRTERLRLEEPHVEAAADYARYYSRNAAHLEPWEGPFRPEVFDAASWERTLVRRSADQHARRAARFALYELEADSEIVGLCNFTEIVRGRFLACYLGYSLAESAVGRGYMFEALQAAIAYIFSDYGLHRIMANYMPHNARSARLLERLGFSVEGRAPDYLFIGDAWRDHVLTSLVNPKARPRS